MSSSHLAKISSLTILAISISACSSSNHSTQNVSSPIPQQPAADKAAADKAAADKAAADKAAADKAAADKAAADKAAADKAAADKAAADKAAADEISKAKGGISNNQYPLNTVVGNSSIASSSISNASTSEQRVQSVVYNQPYSVVLGNYSGNISYNNQSGNIFSDNRNSSISINGLKTEVNALPNVGTATYIGKAFNGTYSPGEFDFNTFTSSQDKIKQGQLNYTVNFSNKTGSGSITGLGDTINLSQGQISGANINSTAQQSYRQGSYTLGFYGKNAEEVAGKVVFNGKDTVGFGGTRGDISK